jgi:S1-C subfamily serine protease
MISKTATRRSARSSRTLWLALIASAAFALSANAAEKPQLQELLKAVVKVSAEIPPEARTAEYLGTKREGSGVVIDADGLVLTIGYLIMESIGASIQLGDGKAVQAHFVAYDHDTGFGLLRAASPLGVKPIELGSSKRLAERDQVLAASHGGQGNVVGAYVVSRRDFAGYWEYLLPDAIFTSPPHLNFGGAALLDRNGQLVGIGSLIVPDAAEPGENLPGNMFVPIDALKPIMGDLLTRGRSTKTPRPWLGINSQEFRGLLFVTRVSTDGPAHAAGIREGDVVLGVAGQPVQELAEFYRRVWALGDAGVPVPLTLLRRSVPTEVTVKSIDRYAWLRFRMSY